MDINLDSRNIIEIIQQVRIEFLIRAINKQAKKSDYGKIIQYLGNPSQYLDSKEQFTLPDNNVDKIKLLDNIELRKIAITHLHDAYCKDPQKFGDIFSDGQYIIWNNIFDCAENLVAIEESVNQIKYSAKKDNYLNSCEVVKKYLSLLAESYKEMTILERTLGIDRYLAVTGLKIDIEILHDFLRKIRNLCNDRLDSTIIEFQLSYNISTIAKILKKMLGIQIEETAITSSFDSNQRRVIFLLLDGFGYTQYLWNLSGVRERKSVTYSTNLFEWLSQFEEFNDKRILASTLVTDTGSALSTIFSGELPSSTGIFASKISNGTSLVNVKQPKFDSLRSVAKKYPNTFLSDLNGIRICIFDGAGKHNDGSSASFSELIYSNFERIPTSPSERIFIQILKKIDVSSEKQLSIGYFPLLDTTGHSIGSFTSFESYEYEKLNIVLVDFLLKLAYTKKELFDNNTTLAITADHGMFETSRKKISLNELKTAFSSNNLPPPFIIINNRSILFYRISFKNIAEAKKVVQEFLETKGIIGKVLIRSDELMDRLWDSHNSNCPMMVLLIKGDGIGIQHEIDEELLHHGGHGGCSCEEVFVPFITVTLSPNLHSQLINHFAKLT